MSCHIISVIALFLTAGQMDLARSKAFLCGLCANDRYSTEDLTQSRSDADAGRGCYLRCFYRIYFDPGLAAENEFDPGRFERALHARERAFVRQSSRSKSAIVFVATSLAFANSLWDQPSRARAARHCAAEIVIFRLSYLTFSMSC
jgi:hypothetical protein